MSANGAGIRPRILLLAGQAFALGLTIAWVTIPANTIFLQSFGPQLLPVTYIGAAVAGVAASTLLARALGTRALAQVAARLLATVAAVLAIGWVILRSLDATWISFAALVVLPLMIPVGFMFVVGQAGMLLDVRVLKVLYPRVIGGFALGFTVGGLASAPLLQLLGGTEQLFLAAATSALVLLALVLATLRRFPAELAELEDTDAGSSDVTLRSLLTTRFVALIMAFQMLSAVESQWLDYLMYDRASARYPDSADLAQFIGRFSAITYGADIVFLFLIAGVLLRRFGLRLGLLANPVVVLTVVLAILAATAAQGSGATLVFVLIVGARVSDLVLSDGTSRTSVSTAYQAVPGRLRQAAQANVESLAVPMAIGFSGVVLLVVQATVGTDGPIMFVITGGVLAAWVVCSAAIYRDYRANLLANLRARLLEPGDLTVDEMSSGLIVDRLLDSDDPRDVRLGISVLSSLGRPDLVDHLERLALEGRPDIHEHVVDRLAAAHPGRAVDVARAGLGHAAPLVRAASLSTLASLGSDEDARVAALLLHDPDRTVARAAAAVVSRHGATAELDEVASLVASLARSASPADRREAATILGRCRPGPWLDRTVLADLLGDPEPTVAIGGLDAIDWTVDGELGPVVIELLGRRPTAAAASQALGRGGSRALPVLDGCLASGRSIAASHRSLCARVCRDIGGDEATVVLVRHASDPDRDVGLAVVRALSSRPDRTPSAEDEELATRLLAADLVDVAHLLLAAEALAGIGSAEPLRGAIDDEVRLVQRRVFAALSLSHGAEPIGRVRTQLAHPSPRVHAMAMEWLDVTLSGADRRALILVDPALAPRARANALAKACGVAPVAPGPLLRDLAEDPEDRWRRPWISACAIVALVGSPEAGLDLAALRRDPIVDVDGIVAETVDGLLARERSRV